MEFELPEKYRNGTSIFPPINASTNLKKSLKILWVARYSKKNMEQRGVWCVNEIIKNKTNYILHKIQASVRLFFWWIGINFVPVVCGHMQNALFIIFSLVNVNKVLFLFREVVDSLWVLYKVFGLINVLFA